MDVLEVVQPLWTYLRKCYHHGRTSGRATRMDVLEEVQPLWTYLKKCNLYGRT